MDDEQPYAGTHRTDPLAHVEVTIVALFCWGVASLNIPQTLRLPGLALSRAQRGLLFHIL